MRFYISFLSAILLFTACGEDARPCVDDNYGIIKLNFSSSVKHSTLVTFSDGSLRDKITPPGILTDTLHLRPGDYALNITSIDNAGLVIDSEIRSTGVLVCEEVVFDVGV